MKGSIMISFLCFTNVTLNKQRWHSPCPHADSIGCFRLAAFSGLGVVSSLMAARLILLTFSYDKVAKQLMIKLIFSEMFARFCKCKNQNTLGTSWNLMFAWDTGHTTAIRFITGGMMRQGRDTLRPGLHSPGEHLQPRHCHEVPWTGGIQGSSGEDIVMVQ